MAVNLTVFDPVTKNSRSISLEIDTAVVQQDANGSYDYFIRLSTSAKSVDGLPIPTYYIRKLDDLVDGATWHGTPPVGVPNTDPYPTMTLAIADYVEHMIEGDTQQKAMSFTL